MPISHELQQYTSRLLLLRLAPRITEKETLQACNRVIEAELGGIVVKPCYLKQAVTQLRQSDTRVGTVIGYPNGLHTRYTLKAETKIALTEGAQSLFTPVNPGYLIEGNFQSLSDDLQTVCGLAHMNGALAYSIVDVQVLSNQRCQDLVEISKNAGTDGLVLLNNQQEPPEKLIRHYPMLGDFFTIGIFTNTLHKKDLPALGEAGVLFFAAENLPDYFPD